MTPRIVLTAHQEALDLQYQALLRDGDRAGAAGGYANLGWFETGKESHAAASEELVDRVIDMLARKRGRVLDVGCGPGGSTLRLSRHFEADQIDAINISAGQLDIARRHAPQCRFHLMAAERLEFAEETFDAVVCIEAALHFEGRREFLAEALRVLKPGGEIAVADLVFREQPSGAEGFFARQECYASIEAYRELWEGVGLKPDKIVNATRETWNGFIRSLRTNALHDIGRGTIGEKEFQRQIARSRTMAGLPVLGYLLVHATKPG